MKKTSSRSQRGSKGIKGKHILQICVLLGVCIWLIYQVKYSHDKKKEFFEKDVKKSTLLSSEDGLVKLGRKDLLPGYNNRDSKHVEDEDDEDEEKERKSKVENGSHEEEDDDEVVEEDEEDKNKQGDEVVEEDEEENKHEEDEIDEQEQSKTGGDTDKDDELLDEEGKETVDETHEVNYKADDASSAVSSSHESRILNTEKPKESSGNLTETVQENDPNVEVKTRKESGLKLGEAESGDFVNKTVTEVKDGESESSKIAVTELRNVTVNGSVTEATILEVSRYLQNETEIMRERNQEHDKAKDSPPSGTSDLQTVFKIEQTRNESHPNITVSANITNNGSIQDESKNSTSEPFLIENILGSNKTEVKENSTGEKQSSKPFTTEQTEEADDTSETKILQEERKALTDPQTLPDIRTKGNEEEAMAAE